MIQFQIPDEALDQLRAILERDGDTQWEIGQFIVDYWQEVLKYAKPGEIGDLHAELIRQFAKGTGADRTTLRDREKMRLFFSDKDRAKFPTFSYHQWRALRKAGEDWERWAILAYNGGWSVAQIRREMALEKDPKEVLLKRINKLGISIRKILDDQDVPKEVRTSLSLIPTILDDTKELLNG